MAINWVDHMFKQFQTRKLIFLKFPCSSCSIPEPNKSWMLHMLLLMPCSLPRLQHAVDLPRHWDHGVEWLGCFFWCSPDLAVQNPWDAMRHTYAIWLPSDMSDISGIHMTYHMIHLIYLWYIDIKIIWYVNGPYKGSRGVPPLDLTQRPGPQPQISWVIPGTRRLEPLTGRGYTMSHQISCYLLLVVNYYIIMVNYCYMLYGYIWLIFLTVCQIWLTPKRVDFPAGIAARWESLVLFPAGIATSGNADLWNLMKWWWRPSGIGRQLTMDNYG